MTSARDERRALADLLDWVGPAATTLCEGWTARDLVAHLVLRESRPDAAPGIGIPALAGYTAKVQTQLADRPYPQLVEDFRSGPAPYWPTRIPAVDDRVNLAEFFIHHEDVARANPQAQSRPLDDDLQATLWQTLGVMGRITCLRAPAGVIAVAPGHGRHVLKGSTKAGSIVVTGAPAEILLYAAGRGSYAEVELSGSQTALAAMADWTPGL